VPFRAEGLIYFFAHDVTAEGSGRKDPSAQSQLERRILELTDANSELEAFQYSPRTTCAHLCAS
jgi:hypothetical protein